MLLEQADEAKGLAEDDAAASRAAVAEAHAAAQRLLSAQASRPSANAAITAAEPSPHCCASWTAAQTTT
jgi:hypothetical protein